MEIAVLFRSNTDSQYFEHLRSLSKQLSASLIAAAKRFHSAGTVIDNFLILDKDHSYVQLSRSQCYTIKEALIIFHTVAILHPELFEGRVQRVGFMVVCRLALNSIMIVMEFIADNDNYVYEKPKTEQPKPETFPRFETPKTEPEFPTEPDSPHD